MFRAHDTKLQRDVALKVLPENFVHDEERITRFQREAQLLAALNHPNIAQIYGAEESPLGRCLILELVEGQTLAERIKTGVLSIRDSLDIARQVAEALEAAHDRGIIHRDLKPANIKITPDGRVKVLDFGLARMFQPADSVQDASNSPTVIDASLAGVILGTAAYMSPEQARGKQIDKRTDIWSFGCVLFEMLTGEPMFAAETVSDTVARILEREPLWTKLPPALPPTIRTLLVRCLKKDSRDRLHDMGDARIEIVDAMTSPETSQRRTRNLWMWAATLLLAALIILVSYVTMVRTAPTGSPVRFSIPMPADMAFVDTVALSPNGDRIAFVGAARSAQTQVFIRNLATPNAVRVAGTEGGSFPFWSPDGQYLGFLAAGMLKKVIPGAAPVDICTVDPNTTFGGSWSKDGVIILGGVPNLRRVPAGGGKAEPLVLKDDPVKAVASLLPQFLPDGRHFLYLSYGTQGQQMALYAGSLDSAQSKRLFETDSNVRFANDHLLLVKGNALVSQAFDANRLEIQGGVVPIAQDAAPGFLSAPPDLSVSNDGILAFMSARRGQRGRLVVFDRAGHEMGVIQQADDEELLNPAISPDGKLVAVNRMDPNAGKWDIWTVDLATNVRTRITSTPGVNSDPVWSPDGNWIAFASGRQDGKVALYRKSLVGDAKEELLFEGGPENLPLIPEDISPDGKKILFVRGTDTHLWLLPVDGDHKPAPLTQSNFMEYAGRISPDGKWIAYAADDTSGMEIYVQRFGTTGEKKRISRNGGIHPRWRGDGKELVYWEDPSRLMAVDFSGSADQMNIGAPHLLLPSQINLRGLRDNRPHFDITRDGQRIILRQLAGLQTDPVQIILNWPKLLDQR